MEFRLKGKEFTVGADVNMIPKYQLYEVTL